MDKIFKRFNFDDDDHSVRQYVWTPWPKFGHSPVKLEFEFLHVKNKFAKIENKSFEIVVAF